MRTRTLRGWRVFAALLCGFGCFVRARADEALLESGKRTPAWAAEAVWYQIFPERFRNGDTKNDPTRETLEFPIEPGSNWRPTGWGSDWYRREAWEKECGPDFYKDGVFHRRYGGDLQGVMDRLDYLRELGITAIYFNPLFQSRSLHKYDGNSYHHIDVNFGPDPKGDLQLMAGESADPASWKWTAADRLFLELVRKAHASGLKVIIDGVFNHTGRDFFAFKDLREKQERSSYRDWYRIKAFDDPNTKRNEFEYEGWWGHLTLPVLATTPDGRDMHPGPKEYIFNATRRWMKPVIDGNPADGVDGWRLDVAEEKPEKFWSDWNALVFSLNPDAYTVAEIWKDAARYIEANGFSAPMNYYAFAIPIRGWLIDNHPTVPPSRFMKLLDDRRMAFPRANQYVMQNLLDSHDTERLPTMIANANLSKYDGSGEIPFNVGNNSPRDSAHYDIQRPDERVWRIVRMGVLLQMTYVGAPMIYYGAEAGMWGAQDPDNRQPMLWADLRYDAGSEDPLGRARRADPVKFDPSAFAFYKRAIGLRRGADCFRTGAYRTIGAWNAENCIAFVRTGRATSRIVALNRHETRTQTVVVVLTPEEFAHFGAPKIEFITSGDVSEATVARNDGTLVLEIPPLAGVVIAGE